MDHTLTGRLWGLLKAAEAIFTTMGILTSGVVAGWSLGARRYSAFVENERLRLLPVRVSRYEGDLLRGLTKPGNAGGSSSAPRLTRGNSIS